MKNIALVIGVLAIGFILWASTEVDQKREQAVKDCVQWEVDYSNKITCVEYE